MLQVIDEHQAIFSALKKGDQKKSYNLMMQHLSNTEAILLSHL
jgi:DNA-binding GntR family transcriptional regulator